jgi:hypothetical protein
LVTALIGALKVITSVVIVHRITGFSDFVHRLDSKELEEKHDVSETGCVSVLR